MNGFKAFLLCILLSPAACIKMAKEAKNGSALFLMYKTPFIQPKVIAFWQTPKEYLPEALSSDKLFIENLSPDTLIFQINRPAYIRGLNYQNAGKDLAFDLVSRIKGSAVSVSGHLIFVRRNEAETISLSIDDSIFFLTNLPPLK